MGGSPRPGHRGRGAAQAVPASRSPAPWRDVDRRSLPPCRPYAHPTAHHRLRRDRPARRARDGPRGHRTRRPVRTASAKAKAKAYGKRCKHQSRRHAAGRRVELQPLHHRDGEDRQGQGGPEARLPHAERDAARKRSPYGRCVVAGKKLQRQLNGDEQYTDPLG